MTEHGVVSVLADQQARAAVGPAWAAAVKALSPHISFVRCSVGPDASGALDMGLLKSGLRAFAGVGLEVRAVLELSLGPQALHNPNEALGLGGDPLKNAFIAAWTTRAIALLNDLGPLCPSTVWIANEPNLMAAANPLGSGQVIPPLVMGDVADPSKPSSLSPEVAWSLLCFASQWIRRKCPRVKTVLPGALSYDAAFLTSQYDAWVGDYIDRGFAYLHDHGFHGPWYFSGLCLNVEGPVSASYAAYTASGLARHKQDHGIVGSTVIGEWGVPNGLPGHPIDAVVMRSTADALAGICSSMSFFSAHPAGGYGAIGLSYAHGEILPGAPLEWGRLLPSMLASLATPAPVRAP